MNEGIVGSCTREPRSIEEVVAKYKGKPWSPEVRALIEAEVGAFVGEKVYAYLEGEDKITVRKLSEMNTPGVVVPEEDPTLQTVMIELVRAQSAMNAPDPKNAPPEMVEDAYLHVVEAVRQLVALTS